MKLLHFCAPSAYTYRRLYGFLLRSADGCFCLFELWGRNGLDGSCEALAAYRVRRRLAKQVALNTKANNEFALAA